MSIIKKIVEAPAEALDKSVETLKKTVNTIFSKEPLHGPVRYWKMLGPGLTTGAADDDPSGIATYSQTGAQYGFRFLWLAVLTFPLMAIVQEMCARIGLVSGQGLAANIKDHFSRRVLYISTALLFAANAFNIGADLGAMAKVCQLLAPRASFALLIIFFAVVSLLLQIFTTYERYARYLKYLALILLSYVATGLVITLDWPQVLQYAITPSFAFTKDQFFIIMAVLGTTISPYLFFWQTSQEVEEEILSGKINIQDRLGAGRGDIARMRTDVWSGMFISNVVMFFIIAVCAATLFSHGISNINTAADAAAALRPLAGEKAYILFALGVIGTGLLALPVLAGSASYAIAESFSWEQGLYRKLHEAYAFYGILIIAMLVGLVINFIHLDPIKALIYSAVANGFVAPVILVLIVLLSSNKKIMGEWVNTTFTQGLGWLITGLMILSGIGTVVALFL